MVRQSLFAKDSELEGHKTAITRKEPFASESLGRHRGPSLEYFYLIACL